MIGFDTADDAAVYRVSPDIAIISTVDFITPPVDDPYWFGQIAAANSISDVYAMGGKPLTALNVVMFPASQLDTGVLKEIIRGGHDKVVEAGAVLAGGHTVEDNEPKYGLSVTGVVHPDKILANRGAQPGDALLLTKPLGSGVLFNAVRAKKLPYRLLEQDILPSLVALNGPALENALPYEIHACTDVTGFGILGHTLEMARASDCAVTLRFHDLPFYPHALAMYRKKVTTGSNTANRELVLPFLTIARRLSTAEEELLFDPQTSGGLLFALPADQAALLARDLAAAHNTSAAVIGTVTQGPAGITIA